MDPREPVPKSTGRGFLSCHGPSSLCAEIQPEPLTSFRLQQPIWPCLLRYAPSDSSTYRRGYACGVLSRKPRIQDYLGGFATKAGEKSGLACLPCVYGTPIQRLDRLGWIIPVYFVTVTVREETVIQDAGMPMSTSRGLISVLIS